MSRRWVAALLLLGVAAGCGIPEDEAYRPISPNEIPFGLQETTTTSSTTTIASTTTLPPRETTTTVPTETVLVYFVDGAVLAEVTRNLPQVVSPDDVLAALAEGPDLDTDPVGLRTSIPDGMLRAVAVAGGIATVDLAPTLLDLVGEEQVLALAQIVATLTARPGIGRVAFTVAGQPVDVPRADGSVAQGSVSRDDFASLLPPPPGG